MAASTDPQEIVINSLEEINKKARSNDEQIFDVEKTVIETSDSIKHLQAVMDTVQNRLTKQNNDLVEYV